MTTIMMTTMFCNKNLEDENFKKQRPFSCNNQHNNNASGYGMTHVRIVIVQFGFCILSSSMVEFFLRKQYTHTHTHTHILYKLPWTWNSFHACYWIIIALLNMQTMTKNQVQPKSPTTHTTSFHTRNHPDSMEFWHGPITPE